MSQPRTKPRPRLVFSTAPFFRYPVREAFRHAAGFDQPLPIQYARFIARALTGDFGTSLRYREPVLPLVLARLPLTLALTLSGLGDAQMAQEKLRAEKRLRIEHLELTMREKHGMDLAATAVSATDARLCSRNAAASLPVSVR